MRCSGNFSAVNDLQRTALEPANSRPRGVSRQHPATSIAALTPVSPHAGPQHTETSNERPTSEVAAFTNKVVTTLGQHGVPFQQAQPRAPIIGTTPSITARGPTRLVLTTGPHPQQTPPSTKCAGTDEIPTGPIHPPGVTAPRADIVKYLRKTNIFFRIALECPRHLTGRCPFFRDMCPEGALAATNPSPARKSYGIPYVGPSHRLFALTDEVQNLLIAWGIATPGIDRYCSSCERGIGWLPRGPPRGSCRERTGSAPLDGAGTASRTRIGSRCWSC